MPGVDPGPEADLRQPGVPAASSGAPPPPIDVPNADDVTDGILGSIRLFFLFVAAAIALPFLLGAFFLWRRVRRGNVEDRQALADDCATAREDLIALGDELRAVDLDVSMPAADPAGKAQYERALGCYERADRALGRASNRRRLERATSILTEGRTAIERAKAHFGRQAQSIR